MQNRSYVFNCLFKSLDFLSKTWHFNKFCNKDIVVLTVCKAKLFALVLKPGIFTVFDPNYDLHFNSRYGTFAWIPYPIEVVEATEASVALWVRFSEAEGTGTFLTMFIG